MNIYKIDTKEVIEVNADTYAFQIEDRVVLNSVDASTQLRKVVAFAGYIPHIVWGEKAYSINTDVKCINASNEIAYNVVCPSPTLKVDTTTYVNPLTGDFVPQDTEGAITEYEFVRNVIHYGAGSDLLRLIFKGILRAETANNTNRYL